MEPLINRDLKLKKVALKMIATVMKSKSLDIKLKTKTRKEIVEQESQASITKFLSIFKKQKKYKFD